MLNQALQVEPKLDAPGAGLPLPELWVARLRFGWQSRRTSSEQADALFARERNKILSLARACPEEVGARRVLIKRLRGMEDSSRFWSVYMVLDHLRITNLSFAGAVRLLCRGQVPERTASTAAVKPDSKMTVQIIGEFERSCEFFKKCASEFPDLKTKLRYAHPWFGPLDAAEWHFIAGFHMELHRRQIEAILRNLN